MKQVLYVIAVLGVAFAFQLGATANATSYWSKSLLIKITDKPPIDLKRTRDDDRWSWDWGDAD